MCTFLPANKILKTKKWKEISQTAEEEENQTKTKNKQQKQVSFHRKKRGTKNDAGLKVFWVSEREGERGGDKRAKCLK